MTESERICLNCNGGRWVADGFGGWVRCPECNPEPPEPPVKVEFHRGARVRRAEEKKAA